MKTRQATMLAVAFMVGCLITVSQGQGCVSDMMLVIDGSSTVGSTNFVDMIRTVETYINDTFLNFPNVRIGLVVFGTTVTKSTSLYAASSQSSLLAELNSVTYPNSLRNTHLALNQARTTLTNTARTGSPKDIILVTIGLATSGTTTIQEANAARQSSINIYVLGIEADVIGSPNILDQFRQQLQLIAPSRVTAVTDFSAFPSSLGNIPNTLCQVLIITGLSSVARFTTETIILTVTLNQEGIQNGFWRKNGAALPQSPRYSVTTDNAFQRLIIVNAQTSDSGTYSYTVGSQFTSTTVSVNAVIISYDRTVLSFVGQTAILTVNLQTPTCSAIGQWTKDSSTITPDGTKYVYNVQNSCLQHVLRISSASTFDTGTYSFTINSQTVQTVLTISTSSVPIDGGLSQWSQWTSSQCSVTCGTNAFKTRFRNRECNNPVPQNNGASCTGALQESETISCGLLGCPVNGGLTQWTQWNGASVNCPLTCGSNAIKFAVRVRTCTDPRPQNGGLFCEGDLFQRRTENCGLTIDCPTPVNGGVTNWGFWSNPPCNVTCGVSAIKQIQRFRTCTNPPPSGGGLNCFENLQETTTINCGLVGCPVDGGVSQWGAWNSNSVECPFTCGFTATKTVQRFRACDNPTPANGGASCPENLVETKTVTCGFAACQSAVNGGVGQWSAWNTASVNCPVTCGTGAIKTIERTRNCDNPPPSNGGRQCLENLVEQTQVNCGLIGCPVNGGLSQWEAWNTDAIICPFTCGITATKIVERIRRCNNPPPSNGGQNCIGPLFETTTVSCNSPACPVPINGGVSQWGNWNNPQCSVTCGEAFKIITRTRTCTNPPPSNGGVDCTQPLTETSRVSCGLIGCPINGGVGAWSQWGSPSCFQSCGPNTATGVSTRSRNCDNPRPSSGGAFCTESLRETTLRNCQYTPCPAIVDGGVSQWNAWSNPTCSVSCGTSATKVITRTRFCNNPSPSNGGRQCVDIGLNLVETAVINCGLSGCPVNGGVSAWGQWAIPVCPETCGLNRVRTVTRTRSCDNPAPQNGGAQCSEDLVETQIRSCVLPQCPSPVNGGFTEWTTWNIVACAQTCGASLTTLGSRVRSCTNPVPRNGGADCVGDRFQTQSYSCGFNDCPVDGGLSLWTQWSVTPCLFTCGQSLTTTAVRTRSCTNPPPSNGGKDCVLLGSTRQTELRSCNRDPCPVDGGLSQWTQWNIPTCLRTCGSTLTTTATRVRFCNNPTPAFGGRNCSLLGPLSNSETRSCGLSTCAIDGGLSEWSQWNIVTCTATCGSFITTASRFRTCTNPPPTDGGRDCTGLGETSETESRSCNLQPCPIDGGLTQWSQWNVVLCTATCGSNLQTTASRFRTCTNPTPNFGGRNCSGLGETFETVTRSCGVNDCPIDGGLSQWTQWNIPTCPRTCGSTLTTTATRVRFCNNPTPAFGGRDCSLLGPLSNSETRSCNRPACPIDGGYTQWSQWNVVPCFVTCGQAASTSASRFRTCTNPPPTDGGRDCITAGLGAASQTDTRSCGLSPCPINGGLSQWSQWDVPECPATCGDVRTTATRFRSCTDPSPQFGGNDCTGLGETFQTESRRCILPTCAINGGFTEWTPWNFQGCPGSCGTDIFRTVTRNRFCTNPTPQFGGRNCTGNFFESYTENCNLPSCARDGGISQWTAWVEPQCVVTCGRSATFIAYRQRFCNSPSPRDGGRNCTESRWDTQTRNCGLQACPLDGGVTPWTQWSGPVCTQSCGRTLTRTVQRFRSCNNPTPSSGGQNCTASLVQQEIRNCGLPSCPIDGGLSLWTGWSVPQCSRTCGRSLTVTATRVRFCNSPYPQYGGRNCTGSLFDSEARSCGLPVCRVDGGFSIWGQWSLSRCTQTCGINVITQATRTRTCTDPEPSDGGAPCSGSFSETTTRGCNLNHCPINGGLTQWTQWNVPTCAVTCGQNRFVTAHRYRGCTNPIPRYGGLNCSGSLAETESRSCNLSPCPIDGGLTQWSSWVATPCPRTCGTQITRSVSRTRTCTNPSPSNGGRGCTQSLFESETRSCGLQSCPIDGGISLWSQWSDPPCPITCGPSARKVVTRTRVCNNPTPQFGGRVCTESSYEYEFRTCGLGNCPVNGGVTLWTPWSDPPCDVTCGVGITRSVTRTRQCTNPAPQFGGNDCTESLTETTTRSCTVPRCPVDGGLSSWSQWSDPPCPVTCGTAATKRVVRSRSCTNPIPRFDGAGCGNDTLREEEIRSCNLPRCPARLQGLCQATTNVNGVGYRYHPTDCDKYIQCYFNPNGYVIGVYRSCPFGYYWDARTLRCDHPWKVNCPLEKCTGNCTDNYNMEGSCRAHWVCDKGVSKADCCPMGFRFVAGQGCRPDFYCRDPCPTPCANRDVCDKRPDWSNNPRNYNISVGLLGWLQASCVQGNFFDLLECGCSVPQGQSCNPDYDVSFTNNNALNNALASWLSMKDVNILNGYALFDGIGHMFVNITQKAPASDCPLILRFRFSESRNVVGRKILASTSDCYKANTLIIAYEADAVVFEMKSVFGQIFRMPISLNGFSNFEWKTVTMVYDGKSMIGVVESNNLKYMQMQYAPEISLMECGMRFGSDGSMSTEERFIGSLDSFTIYRCNPGNLYSTVTIP